MPDPTKSLKQTQDEARTRRIIELSKQWGVPTNAIFSKPKYYSQSIWDKPEDAQLESREFFTFGPDGKIARSILDRFEGTNRGYSAGVVNTGLPTVATNPIPSSLDPEALIPQRQFAKGGLIPNKKAFKKDKKLAYGDTLQPISYNNPYAVNSSLQGPIPYQPYQYQIPDSEPLRQGLNNISNYFASEPSSLIPNNASLNGPSFYQSEQLLNADTNQVSQSSYQPLQNPIGDIGQSAPKGGSNFKIPNIHFNTAGPIMAVAGLVNATAEQDRINTEYARQARRNAMVESYNPFPYGTGSQAIYEYGGELSPEKAKKILKDGTVRGKKLTSKQKKFFGWKSNQ